MVSLRMSVVCVDRRESLACFLFNRRKTQSELEYQCMAAKFWDNETERFYEDQYFLDCPVCCSLNSELHVCACTFTMCVNCKDCCVAFNNQCPQCRKLIDTSVCVDLCKLDNVLLIESIETDLLVQHPLWTAETSRDALAEIMMVNGREEVEDMIYEALGSEYRDMYNYLDFWVAVDVLLLTEMPHNVFTAGITPHVPLNYKFDDSILPSDFATMVDYPCEPYIPDEPLFPGIPSIGFDFGAPENNAAARLLNLPAMWDAIGLLRNQRMAPPLQLSAYVLAYAYCVRSTLTKSNMRPTSPHDVCCVCRIKRACPFKCITCRTAKFCSATCIDNSWKPLRVYGGSVVSSMHVPHTYDNCHLMRGQRDVKLFHNPALQVEYQGISDWVPTFKLNVNVPQLDTISATINNISDSTKEKILSTVDNVFAFSQDALGILKSISVPDETLSLVSMLITNVMRHPAGIVSALYSLFNATSLGCGIAALTSLLSLLGFEEKLIGYIITSLTSRCNKPTSENDLEYQSNDGWDGMKNKLMPLLALFSLLMKKSGVSLFDEGITQCSGLLKEAGDIQKMFTAFEDLAEDLGFGFSERTKFVADLKKGISEIIVTVIDIEVQLQTKASIYVHDLYYAPIAEMRTKLLEIRRMLAAKKHDKFISTTMQREVMDISKRFDHVWKKISDVRAKNGIRPTPVGICFVGESQIGKSHVAPIFHSMISAKAHLLYLADPITYACFEDVDCWATWNQQSRDKYDQGYEGQERHYVDDAFLDADNLDHASYITFISNCQIGTYQADIADKGKLYNARFVHVNCNQFPKTSKTILNLEALWNRFPVFYSVMQNPDKIPMNGEYPEDFSHLIFAKNSPLNYNAKEQPKGYYKDDKGCFHPDASEHPELVRSLDQIVDEVIESLIINHKVYQARLETVNGVNYESAHFEGIEIRNPSDYETQQIINLSKSANISRDMSISNDVFNLVAKYPEWNWLRNARVNLEHPIFKGLFKENIVPTSGAHNNCFWHALFGDVIGKEVKYLDAQDFKLLCLDALEESYSRWTEDDIKNYLFWQGSYSESSGFEKVDLNVAKMYLTSNTMTDFSFVPILANLIQETIIVRDGSTGICHEFVHDENTAYNQIPLPINFNYFIHIENRHFSRVVQLSKPYTGCNSFNEVASFVPALRNIDFIFPLLHTNFFEDFKRVKDVQTSLACVTQTLFITGPTGEVDPIFCFFDGHLYNVEHLRLGYNLGFTDIPPSTSGVPRPPRNNSQYYGDKNPKEEHHYKNAKQYFKDHYGFTWAFYYYSSLGTIYIMSYLSELFGWDLKTVVTYATIVTLGTVRLLLGAACIALIFGVIKWLQKPCNFCAKVKDLIDHHSSDCDSFCSDSCSVLLKECHSEYSSWSSSSLCGGVMCAHAFYCKKTNHENCFFNVKINTVTMLYNEFHKNFRIVFKPVKVTEESPDNKSRPKVKKFVFEDLFGKDELITESPDNKSRPKVKKFQFEDDLAVELSSCNSQHEHKCKSCNLTYRHCHKFINPNHSQFNHQCPNRDCVNVVSGFNITGSYLIEDFNRDVLFSSDPEMADRLIWRKTDLVEMVEDDVLNASNCIAHCISADKALSRGVALRVDQVLNVKDKLPTSLELGSVYKVNGDDDIPFVYNIVTKDLYYKKPSFVTFAHSIDKLYQALKADNVKVISIPFLGTGRDRLIKSLVKFLICFMSEKYQIRTLIFTPKTVLEGKAKPTTSRVYDGEPRIYKKDTLFGESKYTDLFMPKFVNNPNIAQPTVNIPDVEEEACLDPNLMPVLSKFQADNIVSIQSVSQQGLDFQGKGLPNGHRVFGWAQSYETLSTAHGVRVGEVCLMSHYAAHNPQKPGLWAIKCVAADHKNDLALWHTLKVKSYNGISLTPAIEFPRYEHLVPPAADYQRATKTFKGLQLLARHGIPLAVDFSYHGAVTDSTGCTKGADDFVVRALSTSAFTEKGDCGSPVFVFQHSCQYKLVGLHHLGSTNYASAYSIVVTREKIQKLRDSVKVEFQSGDILSEYLNFYPQWKTTECEYNKLHLCINNSEDAQGGWLGDGYVDFAGQLIDPLSHKPLLMFPCRDPSTNGEGPSRVNHKTPFYGAFEVQRFPSVLTNRDSRVTDWEQCPEGPHGKDLLIRQTDLYQDIPASKLDLELLSRMTEQLIEYSVDRMTGRDIGISDLTQVLCGDKDISRNFEPMNCQSSNGLPFNLLGKSTGRDLFLVNQNGYGYELLNAEADYCVALYGEKLELARQGYRTISIWKNCLKDELRPWSKITNPKTRLFVASPRDSVMVGRALFGKYKAVWTDMRASFFHSVGINVHSSEWHQTFEEITSFPNVLDEDFEAFDKRELREFILAVACITTETIERVSPDGYRTARMVFWDEMVRTVCVSYDTIMVKKNGNCSGSVLTTVLNSWINMLYHWYCFIKLTGKESLISFLENVKLKTFGDDVIQGISNDVFGVYNFKSIREIMRDIGQVVTPGSKQVVTDDFVQTIDDLVYLKRVFSFDTVIPGYTVAPLNKESIEGVFNFTSIEDGDVVGWHNAIHESLLEASLHGVEYFNHFRKTLREHMLSENFRSKHSSLNKYLLHSLMYSYSSILAEYRSRYFDYIASSPDVAKIN